MPDFARWRKDDAARAADMWTRIQDQPSVIVIRREGAMLAAQTVRIEMGDTAREDLDVRRGLNVTPGVQRAVVFGMRGHATVADTDIQRADRFVVNGFADATEFEVIGVIAVGGEAQAMCEART